MIHPSCLVLNADYSPIGIIDWKKAMVWIYRYSASKYSSIDIIEYHNNHLINVSNGKMPLPAVIKTTRYFKLFNKTVNFSRKNVFIRDNYVCQYCCKKFPMNQLTYDHVIPKSKWLLKDSPTCWTNIVTACVNCNFKKSNKTPTQANMPLQRQPFKPQKSLKYLPLSHHLNTISESTPNEWQRYIGDLLK